ncbi:MAG: tetratricopeptide repeat protein [Deltaproteobacteria bacterium]|nr:tetratricopeptide repeat protein [Deltaproteobacteria bacterium]
MKKKSPPAPDLPKESSDLSIWAAVLAAVIGLAYSNTLNVPFLHDDLANIVENPGIQHIFPIFGSSGVYSLLYRPIAELSFSLNYAAGGLSVTGYHLANIFIHIASALTLFALIRLTIARSPAFSGRLADKATPVAFFAALLWGAHPLNTMAVTYIVQRCESMAGLFYLLTLYGAALSSFGKKPILGFLVAIPAFFLGLGTKEILITAPVIVAAWQFIFTPAPFRETLRRSAPLYAAFAAGISIFAFNQIFSNPVVHKPFYEFDLNPVNYAKTQPEVLVRYLKLAFWPKGLCFDYWWPIEKGLGFIPYAALLVAGFIATVIGLYKRHPASFAGVAFFAVLAPSSSVIALNTPAAEYRMYLPLAAIAAVVAVAAASFALKRGRKAATGLGIAASVIVLALALCTFIRNTDYRDSYALWADTVSKAPLNPRAHDNLGVALADQGDLLGAVTRFNRAIAIDRLYTTAYCNMGRVLVMQNRPSEAIKYYRIGIKLWPTHWRTWSYMGVAQCMAGFWDEGVKSLETALSLNPGNTDTIFKLDKARKGPEGDQEP